MATKLSRSSLTIAFYYRLMTRTHSLQLVKCWLSVKNNCKFDRPAKPSIIAQYPGNINKKLERHFNNLIYAWFPNDIRPEVFSEKDGKSKLFSHNYIYMILTDVEGVRSYCTFLKFNELVLSEDSSPLIVPKSIWVISNDCLFDSQTQFLGVIFK